MPRTRVAVVRSDFPRGKLEHTLRLQAGPGLGVIGLGLLVAFHGFCVTRLWPMARGKAAVPDPAFPYLSLVVIASLVGFIVSEQFVRLDLLDHPHCLRGAYRRRHAETHHTCSAERATCRQAPPGLDGPACTLPRKVAQA